MDGLSRWPVTIELPVQWGELDSFGHVNNVVFLRWFESARIAYFERCGVLDGMILFVLGFFRGRNNTTVAP